MLSNFGYNRLEELACTYLTNLYTYIALKIICIVVFLIFVNVLEIEIKYK